jgi:hypothetical protein
MRKYKIKIYINMHKNIKIPTEIQYYYPIQVGAYGKEKFLSLTDDTGDNISSKNDRYCELTSMYWIWKNDFDSDYIGICHYRRYYDFFDQGMKRKFVREYSYQWENIFPHSAINKINCADIIPDLLKKHDIILLEKSKIKPNLEKQYGKYHDANDLQILHDVLIYKHPEYKKTWDIVMHKNRMSIGNMFIAKNVIFKDYAAWLFDILFEVEKYIPPKEDTYQNRTFGFMSEWLLNIYVFHHQYSVQYLPLIFLGDRDHIVKLNIGECIKKIIGSY